jgi:CheY-like chemotaxis protein
MNMPLRDDYQTVPVLLIDPDAQSRGLVRDQLAYGSMIGRFRVFEVASAAEAMMCLTTNAAMFCDALARPGIIVTEIALPEHEEAGWTLLRQIRCDTQTSHLCTVCLTTRSDATSKFRGIQEADDYVVKPTDSQDFPRRLLLLVRSRQIPSKLQDGTTTITQTRIITSF